MLGDEKSVRDTVRESWLRRFEKMQAVNSDTVVADDTDHEMIARTDKVEKEPPREIIVLSDEEESSVASKQSLTPIKLRKRARSPGSPFTSESFAKRMSITDPNDVVYVSSDEEKEVPKNVLKEAGSSSETKKRVLLPPKKKQRNPQTPHNDSIVPPFNPIHNPTYDRHILTRSQTLSTILGSPDITHSYLFSFQYDMDFILRQYNAHPKIMAVFQRGTLVPSDLINEHNISLVEITMEQYSSHHPKFIINIHNNSEMRIWLLSCNLTNAEFNYNNQMYWVSPPLFKKQNITQNKFQNNLIRYIDGYTQNHARAKLSHLKTSIMEFDFSLVKGDFISSVPGPTSSYGYLGLFKSLESQGLIPNTWNHRRKLLYQSSSIAGPVRWKNEQASNIFTHAIAPLLLGQFGQDLSKSKIGLLPGTASVDTFERETNSEILIIFPTEKGVASSLFGYDSGGWSHYNPESKIGQFQQSLLNPRFHKSYTQQRKTNPSHTKFLMMSSDNFKTLDWVLFTSHNISKQAWGDLPKRGNSLECVIKNFETGVLITKNDYDGRKLVPLEIGTQKIMSDDEVPIYLPFHVPPEKYGAGDVPWCLQKFNSLQDHDNN